MQPLRVAQSLSSAIHKWGYMELWGLPLHPCTSIQRNTSLPELDLQKHEFKTDKTEADELDKLTTNSN